MVEGTSTEISCNVSQQYIPEWSINGSLYLLYQIPLVFPAISIMDGYEQLTILQVPAELNNTSFQCVVNDGASLLRGTITILRVLPGKIIMAERAKPH